MPLRSTSLRAQLLFMSLLVVIFPMLLATISSFISQKEQISRSLNRELNSSLGACRLYMEKLLERQEMMTLAVASDNTCKTTLRLGVLPQLQKQVGQLASKYGMDFLLITDQHGQLLASYPALAVDRLDLSGHPFVSQARQGRTSAAIHLEDHPHLRLLPVDMAKKRPEASALFAEAAMPIRIRDTMVGVVFSGLRLSDNGALMQDMEKAADAERTILMVKERVVANSCAASDSCSPTAEKSAANPLLQRAYGQEPPGQEPVLVVCADEKKQLAAKWQSLPSISGEPVAVLAALLDYDKAAVLISTASLRLFLVFVVGMLLAATISLLVSNSISSPVKMLVEAMKRLQEGEKGAAIPEDRGDELGILAQGFNQMQERLQRQFKELQQQVKERELAEMQLADEKELLAITLHSIGDGVITTDREGRIAFINPVAEEITGWPNNEAQGRQATEVFHVKTEGDSATPLNPVEQVLAAGEVVGLPTETILVAKDGNRHSIAHSGAPIRDRDNNIIGVVLVVRDVTVEKKMEEELVKAKKLESVGVLAGGIAHDFNNILYVVLGNIELACQFIDQDNRAVSLLDNAQKATKRAAKLTQQLLTFSKGGDPVKETTSLPELVTESADFVLHGSNVSCVYDFAVDLWLAQVDSGQIGQVVQNIIINARHAMDKGGRIFITGRNVTEPLAEEEVPLPPGSYVRLTIQDSGEGIDQQIIDKVFDPYFSTKQTGSGLGLAICYSIIKKHQGHISVQSSPGEGTCFTLLLPADPKAVLTPVQEATAMADVASGHILVMDDEEMVRLVVGEQLTAQGHQVVLVEEGQQAIDAYLRLAREGKAIDLVIMDLTIPGGMGGQEAAAKLLEHDPQAKIVVASGYSTDPVMANYQEYGFIAAPPKPFDLHEFNTILAQVLGG